MGMITTYTGKHFDPLAPEPDMIEIRDIAHALSFICRGNGHVRTFFSVGQHCVNCCKEALARGYSDRVALACLLHDASECYMSDVPRPFKAALTAYVRQEEALLELIYRKYLGTGLTEEEQRQLKEIDDDMLYFDLRELLRDPQDRPEPKIGISLSYAEKPFAEVEAEYLQLFEERMSALLIWDGGGKMTDLKKDADPCENHGGYLC